MLINVDHAPDVVVFQVTVSVPFGLIVGLAVEFDRAIHDGQRNASLLVDVDVYQGVPELVLERFEVLSGLVPIFDPLAAAR